MKTISFKSHHIFQPKYNEVKNYTSHVTKVQFLFDDSYVISTEGWTLPLCNGVLWTSPILTELNLLVLVLIFDNLISICGMEKTI